ncbi:polysaccharide biosynthesis/export family protein [Lysobacter capsici]|uniref:polysaccharide biosynthesis/export family protein n=1 Tax=Lysobacter capsici TaxID=435897 RepID=UPI00177EBC5D|nr:polysaccharide biosynthesis/export family protein [Lysobacter capsici]UOF17313.1 polysaccharide biosynthesis/export family protein [Lysobacter capsici]
MRKLSRALALTAIAGLGGCMWAPGQYMSPKQFAPGKTIEDGHIQLVTITPQFLASEHAASAAAALPTELLSYQPEPYRIGAGDTLYITIWDHPELTSPAGTQQQPAANGRLVRPDGTLFYPYVGVVEARGKTIEELRTIITQRIARVVESPQVDVSIIDYGSQRVTLQGAFVKTDRQPITATPLTLSQAIGAATVDPLRADLSGLVLTRAGRQYRLDLDALNRGDSNAPDIYLKAGDHLFLPYNDRKEVYVVGEVMRPQALNFKTTDMTLTQALGRVGGLNPQTSKGEAVYVIRGVEDMQQKPATIYHLNAKSPASYALASQFAVRPGDVVFVGPAGVTRWNRFVNQLLPLSNVINNAANTQDLLGR